MPEIVSYQYNDTALNFSLSGTQIAQLKKDLQTVQQNIATLGAGGTIYTDILSWISDSSGTHPLSTVDPNVYTWIQGAQGVNGGTFGPGTFIRDYTSEVYQIRYGVTLDPAQLNVASNNIAISLAQGIIANGGELPSIEGLGAADAGSIASGIFDLFGDPQSGVYSPWAGTLLFPFIGDSNFYTTWLLNTDTVQGTVPNFETGGTKSVTFKSVDGTYDLVAALSAFDSTAQTDPFSTFYAAIKSPPIPSSLGPATQTFFTNSYGLTSGQVPGIGTGTPFDAALLTSSVPYYIAGTLTGSTAAKPLVIDDIVVENTAPVVVNAGPGNDYIQIVQADGLIDGGGGTNTADYSRWYSGAPLIFGSSAETVGSSG